MTQPVELNCIGMKCPRPIIEIAKFARRNPPGATLEVKSDDLAFESDVRAWCDTTKAQLLALGRDGATVIATIRLP